MKTEHPTDRLIRLIAEKLIGDSVDDGTPGLAVTHFGYLLADELPELLTQQGHKELADLVSEKLAAWCGY